MNTKYNCGCVESDFDTPIITNNTVECSILLECGDYILKENENKILPE